MPSYHSDAGRHGWIGVDLDGVLCEWDPKYLPGLGPPIPAGIALLKQLLADGHEVRIFTARVAPSPEEPAWRAEAVRLLGGIDDVNLPIDHWVAHWLAVQTTVIENFCNAQIGRVLPITACKDWRMTTCYDDRCVQMIPNTGESLQALVERRLVDMARALQGTD